MPTKEILDFGLSHALARDAVHLPLDANALAIKLDALNLRRFKLGTQHRNNHIKTFHVKSRANDRATYLLRPDWGRRLSELSLAELRAINSAPVDFLIVVGDGLSSLAVDRHAPPLIDAILDVFPAHWSLGNIIIATQARVAIADEIAEVLNAAMVAILIGERPGLSSPDSLGIYLTFNPRIGCTDANRNCISNVRPDGLSYQAAAKKLMWLAQEAARIKMSGIILKDESDQNERLTNETRL